jgi:hypothetical protein
MTVQDSRDIGVMIAGIDSMMFDNAKENLTRRGYLQC